MEDRENDKRETNDEDYETERSCILEKVEVLNIELIKYIIEGRGFSKLEY
jgi:hypothetical protein